MHTAPSRSERKRQAKRARWLAMQTPAVQRFLRPSPLNFVITTNASPAITALKVTQALARQYVNER